MTSDLFLDIQFPFFKNLKVYPVILRLSSVTGAIDIVERKNWIYKPNNVEFIILKTEVRRTLASVRVIQVRSQKYGKKV